MIQRIQTVYLLGATALVALCFFLPMAELITIAGQTDAYTLRGLSRSMAGKSFSEMLMLLSGLVCAATFLTIFFYKKRKRQMRACLIIIVFLVIIEALAFFQLGQLKGELNMMVAYRLPFVFPLISAVLMYLAFRGIKKDEELVRSYDRLR
jgi:hypothetical protein